LWVIGQLIWSVVVFPPLWAALFILGCIGGLCWLGTEIAESRDRFMQECVADGLKPYECRVLWRASQ